MDGLEENASVKNLILLGNGKSLFLKARLPKSRMKKKKGASTVCEIIVSEELPA